MTMRNSTLVDARGLEVHANSDLDQYLNPSTKSNRYFYNGNTVNVVFMGS